MRKVNFRAVIKKGAKSFLFPFLVFVAVLFWQGRHLLGRGKE